MMKRVEKISKPSASFSLNPKQMHKSRFEQMSFKSSDTDYEIPVSSETPSISYNLMNIPAYPPVQRKEPEEEVEEKIVQRMQGPGSEEMDISAGVKKRHALDKMTPRQKDLARKRYPDYHGDQHARHLKDQEEERHARRRKTQEQNREEIEERVERKLWDEITRPKFTEQTWTAMLAPIKHRTRADGVTVYECEDGTYRPRKRDRVGKEEYVTIDHKTPWKQYVFGKAKPEYDGKITKESAEAAYNDLSNLKIMSNKGNSSKNAPQGMLD